MLLSGETGERLGYRPAVRPSPSPQKFTPEMTRRLLARADNFMLAGSGLFRRDYVMAKGGFDGRAGSFADGLLTRKIALTHGFYFCTRRLRGVERLFAGLFQNHRFGGRARTEGAARAAGPHGKRCGFSAMVFRRLPPTMALRRGAAGARIEPAAHRRAPRDGRRDHARPMAAFAAVARNCLSPGSNGGARLSHDPPAACTGSSISSAPIGRAGGPSLRESKAFWPVITVRLRPCDRACVSPP